MDMNEKSQEQCENSIMITIKGLKVWTPEEKSWWRKKPSRQKVVILNNGRIKQGEFAAVLGPSGAGKTTFLVSLAGKCTLPSEGTVMINGKNVRDLHAVEIVPQFEVFMDGLTVIEHLIFMTELKLGSSKNPIYRMILDTLLRDMKLEYLAHTRINELSGGERKLLSLGTCLLSNPQILISDEPTTGLDSYNALLVILALKRLSRSGRTVICSIHQPSCDIYREFNSLILMADGKMVFHGTLDECKAVFESINLHCPLNYNPAEYYIRAVSDQNQNYVEKIMEKYRRRSVDYDGTSLDTSLEYIQLSAFGSFFHTLEIMIYEHGAEEMVESIGGQGIASLISQRNWFKQVHLLLWRQSLTFKRDLKSHIVHLFISVIVTALVIGTCYIGITGTTQRGVQDIRGLLWLVTSEVCFCLSYSALYAFQYEMPLFRREVGVYKCSAFFVARFLSFIPKCIIWSMALVTLATLAVELPNHIITAMEFIATLTIASVAALAYGLAMAALFTSTGIMGDVMPCADLPLFLMSGAFLRISSMPPWLYPLKFISHFYYGMDAISNIYWRQIGEIECQLNSTSACIKDGASVLIENGYSEDFVFQDSLGLFCVTMFWSLLGYYGLKREEKKGYTY